MKSELKDCPICKSKAKLFHGNRRVAGHGESADDVGVVCSKCDLKFLEDRWSNDEVTERFERMITKWNNHLPSKIEKIIGFLTYVYKCDRTITLKRK